MSDALAGVTFDAAGTLFAPAEPVSLTYARAAARHGIQIAPEAVARGFADAFAAAPPLAFPGIAARDLPAAELAWWHAVVRRALGMPGAPLDACVGDLFAHYARPEAWRVFADVPPALAALRAHGLRLAVVSNFDSRLPGLIDGLRLAPLFDAVVWSTGVGAAKPAPAIFAAALAALGTRADATLHVGDGVEADVAGARAAGLRAALVDRAGRRPPLPVGVFAVDTLAALQT